MNTNNLSLWIGAALIWFYIIWRMQANRQPGIDHELDQVLDAEEFKVKGQFDER
ncbi:hypothetical protein J4460_03935 [Candidatus Woesearchaeota archaeon]|nr:hypothetical protein [Candidatus Woesearchaeota archaeon]HIH38267.1 hypothetical protein [Candidatus Woesearchaeota archaeon]HIH49159.1 hypothetical protein [Candidatus Woesearchaeota archaeon]HIJ04423.1 hypothetical protein [Candidatus Woesearchaeota archaeon]